MKTDEKIVSRPFNKLLKCISIEDSDNTIKISFQDSKGQSFVHYQVKPQDCSNKMSSAKAATYLSKLYSFKNPVGKYYSCRCRCRMMNDERMYADVDEIYKRVSTKEGDSKFEQVQQASDNRKQA